MSYFTIFFLLTLTLAESQAGCANDPLLECSGYCYEVVKPLLTYIPSMQTRLEVCEAIKPTDAQTRIAKLEAQLTDQQKWTTNLTNQLEKALAQLEANELFRSTFQQQHIVFETRLQQVEQKQTKIVVQGNQEKTTDLSNLLEKVRLLLENLDKKLEANEIENLKSNKAAAEALAQPNNRTITPDLNQFKKIGSKYYYIEKKTELKWHLALQKCSEMGAHLVSLQNEKELNELIKHLPNERYWLDVHDQQEEKVYMSQTTGKNLFLKWISGEPNNSNNGEDCVELKKSYAAMNDEPCGIPRYFICEANP